MTLRPVALAVALGISFAAPARAQDPGRPMGPGQGATNPVLLEEAKPTYTQDAMRAKIQGIVEVEAIVLATGLVGEVRIHKSLDQVFGLDLEALKAARAWRFKPAMYNGQAVPFKVIIQLEFRLSPRIQADVEFVRGAYRQQTPGLVMPTLKAEKKPAYTSQAKDRKIEGVVEVEAVVDPDGKVDRVRVAKSLDKEFGLDEEALKTARAWTFEPGTLHGKPVPVLVVIQLEFRIR